MRGRWVVNRDIISDFDLRMSSQTIFCVNWYISSNPICITVIWESTAVVRDRQFTQIYFNHVVTVLSQMRVGAALGSRTQVIGQR